MTDAQDVSYQGHGKQTNDDLGQHGDHYKQVAEIYNLNMFYDTQGPLASWQSEKVKGFLKLGPDETLVDLGGGTGAFTMLLGEPEQLLLVEPSSEMLKKASPKLRSINADAAGMCSHGVKADCILVKEAIHHFEGCLPNTLRGLKECLLPGGRILVVTRPHVPEYPFFSGALDAWKAGQSPVEVYTDAFREAGFSTVDVFEERLPLRVEANQWFDMIRSKWWSCFAQFSDDELDHGINDLKANLDTNSNETAIFDFDEVELYILASA
jgi:ubiquinone/menaquinone biosynthesis C-methylase UbiE